MKVTYKSLLSGDLSEPLYLFSEVSAVRAALFKTAPFYRKFFSFIAFITPLYYVLCVFVYLFIYYLPN